MTPTHIPDKDYISSVCKSGQGPETCSYLMFGPEGMSCAKSSPGFMELLKQRIAAGTLGAKGDNCPGFHIVKDAN